MCVIVGKPPAVKMPTEEQLCRMEQHNPDGFGLAYCYPGETLVHIRKGGMDKIHRQDLIAALPKDIDNARVLLHFRNATAGDVCPENCHPFPISNSVKALTSISLDCKAALAHNGVISECSTPTSRSAANTAGKDAKTHELSDTQVFIKEYVSQLKGAYSNPTVRHLIVKATSSKFILLTPEKMFMMGEFTEKDGLYFSNTYWDYDHKQKTNYGFPRTHSPYDDWGDYGSGDYNSSHWDAVTGAWVPNDTVKQTETPPKSSASTDSLKKLSDVSLPFITDAETLKRLMQSGQLAECGFCAGYSRQATLIDGLYACPDCLSQYQLGNYTPTSKKWTPKE